MLTLVIATGISLATFAQPKTGKFTNLGPQVFAAMIQGSIFVEDTQGTPLVYTVVRGEPAHLLAFDVKSKKLLLDKALPESDGVWDMAQASDGYLYIPGAGGNLFKHKPGTQEVEDLGTALKGETYLWNLTAGKDGEVFGATYPGCRVFRYHPKDGFSDVAKGPLVAGENYVRSLAYHAKTGLLYAGIGSHAHLIELNPISGEKKELLPKKYQDKEFVYSLEIVPGKNGSDRLLALLTAGSTTLVYNLKTKQIEQEIQDIDMKAVASDQKGKAAFYTAKGSLMSFNASKSVSLAEKLLADVGTANAIKIIKDDVYILTSGANLVKYSLKNKTSEKTKLAIPAQPIPINALLYGPDGNIWMGGYLAGGHATYHPVSGQKSRLSGLDQTEGMASQGENIYFGIYPKGKFYQYHTQQKWDLKANNPKKLGEIEGQSRSFAVLSIPERQQMVFGMIPEYGKLGGALITLDVKTQELKAFHEPIKQQAISSLAYTGKEILVGTTISGGLGIMPATKEAVLFSWDLDKNQKTHQIIPVAGATAITCLINGPDGYIWGVADGTLFIYDATQRVVLSTHKLYDFPPFKSHIWRSAFLTIHPSGMIYGTGNNHFFKLDPKTKEVTILDKGASLLAMDASGNIYFRKNTDLWKYTP
ncbi:ligand-binding sensor domain-containing protein [Pedobacter puniceum]|uniref:PQQ-binding-like beta-propeller repeat protein n=1 Tax=Pedobacter puniceum TaxID=2666136 RepID=A0A7K0FKS4_9SPHI|nr:hypothetical protein [Pedobacter puniceum]MRX46584.1 hypothetical protein [Pedobacter puniceum]